MDEDKQERRKITKLKCVSTLVTSVNMMNELPLSTRISQTIFQIFTTNTHTVSGSTCILINQSAREQTGVNKHAVVREHTGVNEHIGVR